MKKTAVSICVPAYNEEKNIAKLLKALLSQKTKLVSINSIIVVSSGSTDKTNNIVEKVMKLNSKIKLIKEARRQGKSHAINTFLKKTRTPIVVVESADTIPEENTIENLCKPLIKNKDIGITGGAPFPINSPDTFIGYIIHCWWWFHRNIPRFGEIIAFRNIIQRIPNRVLVDEAFIQATIIKKGLKAVYVDEAKVINKGAETLSELIKQRRKLFVGHAHLHRREGVRISNMTKSSLKLLLFKHKLNNLREFIWFIGGIFVEIYARFLGAYDQYIKKINPYIWETATSTKNLDYSREERTIQ